MLDRVQKNSSVLVHFILKLADGSTADSTYAQGKPALFRLGDRSLSEALEQHLLGLQVGDKRTFTLPTESAFGHTDPALIQHFSPRDFSQTGIPNVGTIMLFSAINGSEMPGIVREVTAESIKVDFNHPLAEQSIHFTIEVLEIKATEEKCHADIAG